MFLRILGFMLFGICVHAQQIGDFTSIAPGPQTSDFLIPATHRFQKIMEEGDPLTEGGALMGNNDFTAYVPINGSSENGYLSINAERIPGGVSILDIQYNTVTRLWQVTRSEAVDFNSVFASAANCSGAVTPWNTIISCEEHTSADLQNDPRFPFEGSRDFNNDGYDDFGWAIEIDPVTKTIIDQPGGLDGPDKLWAMGNFKHENAAIHNNERTVYQGADANVGYLYKFVANGARNLSSGSLYVYKGSKSGSGNWILLNNTTQEEQNSTVAQSANVGATVFNGIEDVEIGPNGLIYFAVKGEDRVYRFQDSDPISGTTVTQMETYVGNATYTITHENGTSSVDWGGGNDNMAFDNAGNLWVLQDAGNFQNYIWVVENGHTQSNPKIKIFGRTPFGSEPTGITFSPDNRFLFMSIQHPDSGNSNTTQIDAAGNAVGFNKSISLVISLQSPTDLIWYLDADADGYAATETVSSPTSPGLGYTTDVLPTTDCDDNDPNVNPDTIWYLDSDGDGFADPTTVKSCQSPGIGYTLVILPTTDCDDSDASINAISIWYLDSDGDGFAHPTTVESCQSPGTGYTNEVLATTDCDDSDASVNASLTWYLDFDGDGFAETTTTESCQSPGTGYTNEVLPTTDCDDSDASINAISTWYLDSDGDGFAHPTTVESCQSPGTGYTNEVLPTTDCNDSDASVNASLTWYLDFDGDGFAETTTTESCQSPGTGYTNEVLPTTDCDDSDASINAISTWYLDSDGDGFAHPTTVESCQSPGTGYTNEVLPTTDCDDFDDSLTIETLWYLDSNNDGLADELPISSCGNPGSGYTNKVLPIKGDLTKNGPIIYPNPTINEVTVLLERTYEVFSIRIFTQDSKLVLDKTIRNTDTITLSLTNQQAGVYFVQIKSDNERVGLYRIIKM